MCSRQFNLKKLEAPNKAQIIVMLTEAEDNTERPPYRHGDDARQMRMAYEYMSQGASAVTYL
jgi:hypothetical protein